MKTSLHFNAADYPEPVLRLILAEAETRNCRPGEAVIHLLNRLEAETRKRHEARARFTKRKEAA